MLITTRGFTIETFADGVFLKLGKRELWLESSGYTPAKLLEIVRSASGGTTVYAMGRALTISGSA